MLTLKIKGSFHYLNKGVLWGTNLMNNLKGKLTRNSWRHQYFPHLIAPKNGSKSSITGNCFRNCSSDCFSLNFCGLGAKNFKMGEPATSCVYKPTRHWDLTAMLHYHWKGHVWWVALIYKLQSYTIQGSREPGNYSQKQQPVQKTVYSPGSLRQPLE